MDCDIYISWNYKTVPARKIWKLSDMGKRLCPSNIERKVSLTFQRKEVSEAPAMRLSKTVTGVLTRSWEADKAASLCELGFLIVGRKKHGILVSHKFLKFP